MSEIPSRDYAEFTGWLEAQGLNPDPDMVCGGGDMHDAFFAGMQAARDLAAAERGEPAMRPHGGTFEVAERGPDGHAITWRSTCRCRQAWTGPTYESAEDEWRRHVHAETGTAPVPMGGKTGRWEP